MYKEAIATFYQCAVACYSSDFILFCCVLMQKVNDIK